MKPGALPMGTQVGRYLLERLVGAGSTAMVYVARDTQLDRKIALKLARPDAPDGKDAARARWIREAGAMAQLHHPNIVSVYEAGVHGEDVFISMELVAGMNLPGWRKAAPRSWREILDVFLQAGRGLAAAHGKGFLHRDFRPDNVLIDEHGAVKVGDFGLARAASVPIGEQDTVERSSPEGADGSPTTSLARIGALTGPAAYLAPEQAMGLGVDARTDQYSYCVALYRAIYGEPPYAKAFPARGPNVIEAPPLGTRVPAWVRAPLLRGLALRPEDRYPTLDELLAELADDPALRRRRAAKYAGALALVALVGASSLTLARRHAALDPCYGPARRLAGVWDEDVKDRMRAAFVATGLRDAPSIGDYAAREMDRTSAAWLAAYTDACGATRETHTATEAALRLRLDCLDEQRIDLRAAAELMSRPDPKDLSAVLGAASTLDLPIECADARALALVDPPPPENRAGIGALRARYGRAKALNGAGQQAQAIAGLRTIPDEAKALGARALEVEALRELASAYSQSEAAGESAKAAEATSRAAQVAEAAHLDVLLAKSLANDAFFSLLLGRPPAEMDAKLERARQAFRRLPPGTSAEMELEMASGSIASVEGRDREAIESTRRSLALAKMLYGPNSGAAAGNEFNLGVMLDPVGEYDDELDLYRQAIASYDARLGPTNTKSIFAEQSLAETYFDLSRFDDCEETLKHLWARTNPTTNEHLIAGILGIQSALLAVRGKRSESLRAAARSLEIVARLHELTSWTMLESYEFLLSAYVRDREPGLAVALYEKGVVPQDTTPASARWVVFLRLAGWAYLDAGQPKKAIPLFERGLAFAPTRRFFPGWVARMRYQLAKALVQTNGDRKRAAALAQKAHDELADLPLMKDLLGEVDAFRTKTFRYTDSALR